MAKSDGRRERESKGRGRNRRDGPKNYWHGERDARDVKDWSFTTTLIRRDRDDNKQKINSMVTGLTWREARAGTTAEVSLMNPASDERVKVEEGHEVKVEYDALGGGGDLRELWTLRVGTIDEALDGSLTLNLEDELAWMGRSRDSWLYKKGKHGGPHKKKQGWTADKIAADVCQRYGVRVGRLAKGKHQIDNLTLDNASPLKVISQAYAREREETGEKFVIRIVKGKLTVDRLRRNRFLLLVSQILVAATMTKTIDSDYATILTVRASTKRKKGDNKKIEVEVQSPREIQERFGNVHAVLELDDTVDSEQEAKQRGKRELARRQKPKRDLSFTLPGDPSVRRGDAVKLKIETLDLNQIVYLKSAEHSVSSGTYTVDCVANFADPYKDPEGDKTREKRCRKAAKKNRGMPRFCENSYDPFAPTAGGRGGRARNRQDHDPRPHRGGDHSGGRGRHHESSRPTRGATAQPNANRKIAAAGKGRK